jgi:hypothetical protein
MINVFLFIEVALQNNHHLKLEQMRNMMVVDAAERFARHHDRAADRYQTSPKTHVDQQLRRSWDDFEKIMDDIAISEITCDKAVSILSRDRLDSDVHQRGKSNVDKVRSSKPPGVPESVSNRLHSSFSLGLIGGLEDDAKEQFPKTMTNQTKPQGFSRREYNAFMGRLRLHML